MIRVGRRVYNKDGSFTDPSYPNFEPLYCLTKSTAYGDLGPYVLKDNKGRNMESLYQFSKLYESVPKRIERYSRYTSQVIWDHPAEKHVENGKITQEYINWREKGFNNPYHVRYPVGFNHRAACVGSIKYDTPL